MSNSTASSSRDASVTLRLWWLLASTALLPGQTRIDLSSQARGALVVPSLAGDFQVVRTNATTLTIGANCLFSSPCNVRFGNVTYTFSGPTTVSLTAGTGFAYVYIDAAGNLTVGHNLALTCSDGCLMIKPVTSFPVDAIPLVTWSATGGTWDALGLDQRASMSAKNITAGLGITTTEVQGQTTVAVDPSAIAFRAPVPVTPFDACTTGNWASDTSFYYVCIASNTWKRAALSSW